MLAIELELLTGRYAATRHDDFERGEWPPHPARLVYALVATAGSDRTAGEEAAIEWLCAQPPPMIAFSDAWPRTTVTAYVPVNDRAGTDAQAPAGTLPRVRQPRTFPAVVPESSIVTYVWEDAEPDAQIGATLAALVGRVVYVGHSSSLVRAAVVARAPAPSLVPGRGERLLRVPSEGLLGALDEVLARYEATSVRGPLPSDYARYGVPEREQESSNRSVFGELVALRRIDGPRLPIAAAEQVAASLRAALLQLVPDPVPDVISGHDGNGAPLERPHVAFVALPDVGHQHASGSLLGLALVLPREIENGVRATLLTALGNLSVLRISRSTAWTLEAAQVSGERPLPRTLQPRTWSASARRYATVTPIELDRYVDDRLGAEAEAVVTASAEYIGLPRPARVSLSPVSAFVGAGHVHDIRRLRDRPRRPLIHAIIDFAEKVEGPVILGSGRFRGLGLCRPLEGT